MAPGIAAGGSFEGGAGDQGGGHRGGWHLIRIPTQAELDRRRGLPHQRLNHAAMRAWCERTCPGAWREGASDAHGTEYLFERRDDAHAFALRWFPFRCS